MNEVNVAAENGVFFLKRTFFTGLRGTLHDMLLRSCVFLRSSTMNTRPILRGINEFYDTATPSNERAKSGTHLIYIF